MKVVQSRFLQGNHFLTMLNFHFLLHLVMSDGVFKLWTGMEIPGIIKAIVESE